MIQVKKIDFEKAEHFDPLGNSLGFLNELQSLDLRIQIAENQIPGYYMLYDDTKYYIASNGVWEDFPAELWHKAFKMVRELYKIQKGIINNNL